MIPAECFLASFLRIVFRLYRYGANAPVQTTSTITTSKAEEFDEKVLASWEYAALPSAGCGTSLTLIPVSLVNFFTRFTSRVCDLPTGPSPRNVMLRPPYFFLIAFAFGTFGGLMPCAVTSATAVAAGPAVPALPAAAMDSEATRAKAPIEPAKASNERRFTVLTPFLMVGGQCPHCPSCGIEEDRPPPAETRLRRSRRTR